ncbi:MAG: glycoside hydrolase family 15 protein [Armatimonadota bacterium]
MPRDLVLGNGALLVNIDRHMNVRDLFYPHVGLSNHLGGRKNRVGVWVDGRFAWLDDTWRIRIGYLPCTLTTECIAEHPGLGLTLRFNDTVHPSYNLFLRRVVVEGAEGREVRLFFGHDFCINETDVGDAAFYHPFTGSMVHYKRDCYILAGGRSGSGGIYEYAAGIKEINGKEGAWRDAEDGVLSMHPIEQGSVDSMVSFVVDGPVDYWLAVGRSLSEVSNLHSVVSGSPMDALLSECEMYWKTWLSRAEGGQGELKELYHRSLLALQTQIDRSGGILAANDSDILQTGKTHYSYVWPRDGALVARALDAAGYGEPARRFFSFCAGLLGETPCFLQKHLPDGTPGPTWHPWVSEDGPEVPCQQDSTALVLWAIGKHFDRWQDTEFANSIYHDLIAPCTDYILEQVEGGLPKPSYDLWESRRGVHLWTCCAVYGALTAATKLAIIFEREKAQHYRCARGMLKKAILEKFYDPALGRFVRNVGDPTLDASMAGVFLFGVLPAGDPRVEATMRAIREGLWTPVGGLARSEDDWYFRKSGPNPWFVTTLWLAEWHITSAQRESDLAPALELLRWVARHTSEAGLLAEQIDSETGEPLSVMPLTWSHAAFVSTYLKFQAKARAL